MRFKKKTFFKIHSWIGIQLSILFFIVCFSGTLATLSREMDWLFQPNIRATYQDQIADKNTIAKNIKALYPNGTITYWESSKAPYLCDVIDLRINQQLLYVFVNPYSGEVQGATVLTFQRFFRDLHYYLFMPFYQIGNFIVLVFGFMLFISTITALFFYKKWWRKLFGLKTGKGSLVFYRSLHRLVGVWSVPFTILFSITGIWYFIERTNIGNVSTIANTKNPKIAALQLDSISFSKLSYTLDYNKAVELAKKEIPHLVVTDIIPPSNNTTPIYLIGKSKVALVRDRANRVWIHPITYEVIGSQKAEEISTVTWLNDIADPLHFGTWGGLTTKLIWFLSGLCISGLVLTGIWSSLKRNLRTKNSKTTFWKYFNLTIIAFLLIFMYLFLIYRYHASFLLILLISLFWVSFAFFAWYIFSYRLKKLKGRH